MPIPEKLKQRLELLGLDESIYSQRTRKCIVARETLPLKHVPWCSDAYFIPPDIEHKGNHPVFDPVSIVPCLALGPKPGDRILDMCAAPGIKTYILSFLTENKAHIAANDINRTRLRRLQALVNRFSLNCSISNISGRKLEGSFNKILLDAPCSGEGMVNKKEKLFRTWSERHVKFLAKKQKKLIAHAFDMLAYDGTLVYSACTFAPEENEGVVDFLLKKHTDAVPVAIHANIHHAGGIRSWDGKEFDSRVAQCMRIYPQHNGTGGFFVAKLTKQA
ncbi:MAG: tRNA methyltransferase [Candidatus Aenigmarchaeota archaeon]|nr:tRNA methyltransferase [Candidatus Aenigmarchaeota archaeon]